MIFVIHDIYHESHHDILDHLLITFDFFFLCYRVKLADRKVPKHPGSRMDDTNAGFCSDASV